MKIDEAVKHLRRCDAVRRAPNDLASIKEAIRSVSQLRAWLDGCETDLAAATVGRSPLPTRDVAAAARTSERAADRIIERADTASSIPELGDALAAGDVSGGHIDAVTAGTKSLEPAQRARFRQRAGQLASQAATMTVDEFRSLIQAEARLITDDDGIARLERQKRACRLRTWMSPSDGMWRLSGSFDPETGLKLAGRLRNTMAALFADSTPPEAPSDPGERTDYLRALALDKLTEGNGSGSGHAEIIVVVNTHTSADADARAHPASHGTSDSERKSRGACDDESQSHGESQSRGVSHGEHGIQHGERESQGGSHGASESDSQGTGGSQGANHGASESHVEGQGQRETTVISTGAGAESSPNSPLDASRTGSGREARPSGPRTAGPETTRPPFARPENPEHATSSGPDDRCSETSGPKTATGGSNASGGSRGASPRGPSVDWGIPVELPWEVLRRLAETPFTDIHAVVVCDGVVLHAPGELNLGRSTRLANKAQRRALRALYPTCAVPGCGVSYQNTKAHHIIWWEHGGLTDFANLLPICSKHHSLVHNGGWHLHLDHHRNLTITLPNDSARLTNAPPRYRSAA